MSGISLGLNKFGLKSHTHCQSCANGNEVDSVVTLTSEVAFHLSFVIFLDIWPMIHNRIVMALTLCCSLMRSILWIRDSFQCEITCEFLCILTKINLEAEIRELAKRERNNSIK